MQSLFGEIWMEFRDLLTIGIAEKTLKMGILRNSPKWQSIKDPKDGRRRLIKYSTLGDSYKEVVRAELCGGLEPEEWLVMLTEQDKAADKLNSRDQLIDKVEDVCQEGYKRHLHLYRETDPRQQRCLSRAAGVVEILAAWYKSNGISWKSYEPVKQVAEWVELNSGEYFYKKYLPTNPIRLKEKVISHAVDGKALKEVISLPRSGNDNRVSKKNEMWWQASAVSLHSSGRNMTQSAIVRKLRDLADIMGKEAPSESTVRMLLRETNFLTIDKRLDLNNKSLQRYRASMPTADAMFADSCWEMDGTRVQLAPHQTWDGLKFLYIVVCRDVYSGAYLGWHFSTSESGHSYRMALKMAVNLTGRVPYELKHDKFPGSNSPEIEHLFGELTQMGVKMTCTSAATGKARAERAFYTLQQVFESDHLAYWGQGIRSSTATAHPTEQYRYQVSKQLKQSGWDFDSAWMAECGVIAAYNHTELSKYSRKHANLHQTPWDLYQNASDETEGRNLEVFEIADLFWATRKEGVRNRCIKIQIKDKKYRYDLLDENHYEILSRYTAPDKKLTVRYELHDMTKIMLFDEKNNFLAEVTEQESIQLHGSAAEWDKAAKWKEKNKAVDARRKQDLNAYLSQLPEEAAILMPTKLSKGVSEDAQTAYLLNNAGEWQGQMVKKEKSSKIKQSNGDDFDPDEFARSQY